jgi:hypothetical protein
MPALHFDVKAMTGRPKFIVRHSTTSAEPDFFSGDEENVCQIFPSVLGYSQYFF